MFVYSIVEKARWSRSAKVVIASINNGGMNKWAICNLVKTFYHLNGGSHLQTTSKGDHVLCLKESRWTIVNLTSDMNETV